MDDKDSKKHQNISIDVGMTTKFINIDYVAPEDENTIFAFLEEYKYTQNFEGSAALVGKTGTAFRTLAKKSPEFKLRLRQSEAIFERKKFGHILKTAVIKTETTREVYDIIDGDINKRILTKVYVDKDIKDNPAAIYRLYDETRKNYDRYVGNTEDEQEDDNKDAVKVLETEALLADILKITDKSEDRQAIIDVAQKHIIKHTSFNVDNDEDS